MPLDPDLRDEALLFVEWAQGAAGPLLPADEPAPERPVAPRSHPVRVSRDPADPSGPAAPLVRTRVREDSGLAADERGRRLAALRVEVAGCVRCPLAGDRTQTVFGEGSVLPRLVVVGEAPGFEEDRTGEPFVGRAGHLLTKMLAAIGLAREDVFICNVLKCRPPSNRSPRPNEVASCRPFLREQLEILAPPLILALGSPAVRELLRTERGVMSLRGRFARTPDGYKVMPSFHPAYLLRNPDAKREAWQDLQKVALELGVELPPR